MMKVDKVHKNDGTSCNHEIVCGTSTFNPYKHGVLFVRQMQTVQTMASGSKRLIRELGNLGLLVICYQNLHKNDKKEKKTKQKHNKLLGKFEMDS